MFTNTKGGDERQNSEGDTQHQRLRKIFEKGKLWKVDGKVEDGFFRSFRRIL